ncbi:recombinase RecT [Streptosporangium sp. NBC_01755]|uniref:recombinase RecT n=1 Tax=Streptosporangium sp. NBC_01755 TaxID=2975949 RepID=UPI002DD984C1|nr:recombinase RecT [Streptosporangium sp. NBC_01755]WSD01520.1 recombinase RecT [Streptosporangium sp. NBC_01755]
MAGQTITNAVAQQEERPAVNALAVRLAKVKDLLESMTPEISKALPAHVTAERMARIALTQCRATPELLTCSAESLVGAVLTCAQLGMEPGPTQEAFLIPRKGQVTFQLGYKGMAKLFWQHPLAAYLTTATVRVGDEFDYDLGTTPHLLHKPNKKDRGEPEGHWYAVFRLINGGFGFAVLDRPAVERRRRSSQFPNGFGWAKSYDEMAEKSALRDMFDTMPKSAEIARALAWDGAVRTDLDPDAIDDAPSIDDDTVEADPVDLDEHGWPTTVPLGGES